MEVGGRDGPCNVTSGRPHDGPFLRVSRHSVTSLVATPLDPSVSPLVCLVSSSAPYHPPHGVTP